MNEENQSPANWQFTGGTQPSTATPGHPEAMPLIQPVTWTASEYVEHDKSTGWFVRFGIVAFLGIGLIFFLTRDITSVILLTILVVIFGVFAGRKPRVLQYRVDNHGITVGEKMYPASLFRSFALMQEGGLHSITLLPLKRLSQSLSVYFAPEDEAAILEAFSQLWPQEVHQPDAVDKFMHRIRF